MRKAPGMKINNSYEDSESSNSSRELNETGPQRIAAIGDHRPPPTVIIEDPEKILNHIYKTRNKLIESTKNSKCETIIIKKDRYPPPVGEFVTENSSNAVDSSEIITEKCARPVVVSLQGEELTFNGKIDTLLSRTREEENEAFGKSAMTEIAVREDDANISGESRRRLLADDNNSVMLTNQKSPDLFETDDKDDDDGDICEGETEFGRYYTDESSTQRKSTTGSENSSTVAENCAENTNSKIAAEEEAILNKIQHALTGVLPPPSVTISQIGIEKMIQLYHDNQKLFVDGTSTAGVDPGSEIKRKRSNLNLSHSIEDVETMEWPEVQNAKAHGIYYNRTIFTEKIDALTLRYVDRYVGAETSSSFVGQNFWSPSSAKKRNMRLKLLRKSPGNRLSHLARRREIFSSEHLAATSRSSAAGSSVTGTRQILLDVAKSAGSKNQRRDRTPGRRFTPSRRKTSASKKKSSAKKKLVFGEPLQRETSKRALFLSPVRTQPPVAIVQVTPEVANRVQKSKRVLFSPEKLPRSTSFSAYAENTTATQAIYPRHNSLNCLNEINENTINLKRKRDCETNEQLIDKKISMMERQKMTPNTQKLYKSYSFSANSENRDQMTLNMMAVADNSSNSSNNNRLSLFRSTSEIIPRSSQPKRELSELHRQKLFWAVSQALKIKKINSSHEKFKEWAGALAKVTKKLYLDFEQNSPGSTSEKMMRLTNRLVFYVLQEKKLDEIYDIESRNLHNLKLKLEKTTSSQSLG